MGLAGRSHFVSPSKMVSVVTRTLLWLVVVYSCVNTVSARPVQYSSDDTDAMFAKIAELLNAHAGASANVTVPGTIGSVPVSLSSTTSTTTTPAPPPAQNSWEMDLEYIRAEKVGEGLLNDPMMHVQVSQDPFLKGYFKRSEFEALIRRNFEVCRLNKHFRMPGQKSIFTRSGVCTDGLTTLNVGEDVKRNVTSSSKSDDANFDYSMVRKFVSG